MNEPTQLMAFTFRILLNSKSSKGLLLSKIRTDGVLAQQAVIARMRRDRVNSSKLKKFLQSERFKTFVKQNSSISNRNAPRLLVHQKPFDFQYIETPLTVSFTNLNLFLKNKPEVKLLKSVFGTLHPYSITALMGNKYYRLHTPPI